LQICCHANVGTRVPAQNNIKTVKIASVTFITVLPAKIGAPIVEFGEAIKNPAYRIPQTEYSGCLDISAHA